MDRSLVNGNKTLGSRRIPGFLSSEHLYLQLNAAYEQQVLPLKSKVTGLRSRLPIKSFLLILELPAVVTMFSDSSKFSLIFQLCQKVLEVQGEGEHLQGSIRFMRP